LTASRSPQPQTAATNPASSSSNATTAPTPYPRQQYAPTQPRQPAASPSQQQQYPPAQRQPPPKPNQPRPQQQTTPNQAHEIPPGMTLPSGVTCEMFSHTL